MKDIKELNKIRKNRRVKKDDYIKELEGANESLRIKNALLYQRLKTISAIANDEGCWLCKSQAIPKAKSSLGSKNEHGDVVDPNNLNDSEALNNEMQDDEISES